MRALVLLSGGIDSALCALLAKKEGRRVGALTISYGQRHAIELERARRLGAAMGLEEHLFLDLPPEVFANSSLTNPSMSVPMDRLIDASIPSTYVPSRNLVFLSLAAAAAEGRGIGEIWIGVNALDYSGYPDCRPEFLAAFEAVLNAGTKAGTEGQPVRVLAPLLRLNKAEIIRAGHDLGLDFSLTWSCYAPAPGNRPCARCDSCVLRARGFGEAGLLDPLTAAGSGGGV